jgi:hypothetical protein
MSDSGSSGIDKLIESLAFIERLNGQKFQINEQIGSAREALQPPLADRLRRTDAEATNRAEMDKAKRGEGYDPTKVEGIVSEYLRENILKEFGK